MIAYDEGRKGLVHVYTGNGKGKTTAALGLGFRAWGRGFRVLMVQFLKGAFTGELVAAEALGPRFRIERGVEMQKFTWNMDPDELLEAGRVQKVLFAGALREIRSGAWDLVILDEVMAGLGTGLLDREEVLGLVRDKPPELELVLTGREAAPELCALADYVSVVDCRAHPIEQGIPAREGIES